jgi:hypothetical protein
MAANRVQGMTQEFRTEEFQAVRLTEEFQAQLTS